MESGQRNGQILNRRLVPARLGELLQEGRRLLASQRQLEELRVRDRHRLALERWQALGKAASANLGDLLAPYAYWQMPAGWSLASERYDLLLLIPEIGRIAASYQLRDERWVRYSFRQLDDHLEYIWGVPQPVKVQVGEDWQVLEQAFSLEAWLTARSLPEALALAEEATAKRAALHEECCHENAAALHHSAGRPPQGPWRDVLPGWVPVA